MIYIKAVKNYINQCKRSSGAYASWTKGKENLYATCYALMTKHYLGGLLSDESDSLNFILKTQDPKTGFFVGPELKEWSSPNGDKHDREHLLLHLSTTVLPVINLFQSKPYFQLKFAHKFLDKKFLNDWLERRDWHDAWLEGNNLLFVGQLLVYLKDKEHIEDAAIRLDEYFNWLNKHIDPQTGLWGSNGYCSPFVAMCGGYHQLLVYYYEQRKVLYRERLVDTTIALQHQDGGFAPSGGGGACEDVDAADILVNMYKQIDYRKAEIRLALRSLLKSIIKKQMPDGGFVYKLETPFKHMGIPATASPAGTSNMMPTWFRVHTLALISEVLTDESLIQIDWQFNDSCSMGWHRQWNKHQHPVIFPDRIVEVLVLLRQNALKKEWYKYHLKRFLPPQFPPVSG